MADEKLNTGPAENISPEAAEPIATPEQAAASEPQQEQTGPAIPESGDVVVSFDKINPPVGVKFEADNIYTLDSNGRMILTILASVAEEESHSKSIIMNWSIDRRFSRGLFLTPALLGSRNGMGQRVPI